MTRTLGDETPLVPTVYGARLVALAAARGVAPAQVLDGTSLAESQLADPAGRMSLGDACRMLWNATEAAKDPSIALELGLSFKAPSHGWFGYAMITCNSLRDAMTLGERFMEIRNGPWRLEFRVEGETAVMRFVELVDAGPMRQLLLEAILGGVVALGEFLIGRSFTDPAIEFRTDLVEQPHHARFRERVPRVRYGCDSNEGRFPSAWLDLPLALREPIANQEAVRALERERTLTSASDLVERARTLLADPANGYPDLERAALALKVSSRTLRRQLTQRGTTYQALRDEARRTHAISLLEQTGLTVASIARNLEYAETAGFVRAFRRWTSESPSDYRRRKRGA